MMIAGIGGGVASRYDSRPKQRIKSCYRCNYAKSPRISARASLVQFTYGAGDEIRTRDILLGRQMLYQLSHPRRAEL